MADLILLIDDPTPDRPETVECPDPELHRTLYAARETTRRLTPAQRAAETEPGFCSWCPGRLPS